MIYWIAIVWLLACVCAVFYVRSWAKKREPPKRVRIPRPKSEAITLPQSQPLNETIRSTQPGQQLKGPSSGRIPSIGAVGTPPRDEYTDPPDSDSYGWPPKR